MHRLAVVGCLLAGLVHGGSALAEPHVLGLTGPEDAEVSRNPNRNPEANEAAPEPAASPRHQDSRQTGGYEADCAQPKDREDSDLCAQWGSVEGVREANRIARESLAFASRANELSRYGLWLGGFEAAALVLTLVFTAIATLAATQAANAATEANERSRELFIADQRPWVSVQIRIDGPIVWNGDEGWLELAYILKNTGKTPALDLQIHSGICIVIGTMDPAKEQVRLSEEVERFTQMNGAALFPGEEEVQGLRTQISSEKINDAKNWMRTKFNSSLDVFPMCIYGCVSYFPYNDSKSHQTGFLLYLSRMLPTGNSGIGPSAGNIPANQLLLSQGPIGGRIT